MVIDHHKERPVVFGFAAVILVALSARPANAQPAASGSTCVTCHSSLTDAALSQPAVLFSGADVHRASRFTCIDCHGGDAGVAAKESAHSVSRGFKGKPVGPAQIQTCARCHSDAEFMRRYAPRQRVDQATEYASSVHGKQLAQGDRQVATCASCHGAHGIRQVNDAKAPVYPTNVAQTCAACHASAEHMRGYKQPDGSALPTTQFADYQRSIHYQALTKANDLSAPTCNDCHGNHGAAPPGAGSVANVCGTCHAVFAQRFEGTTHQQIFDRGCVECHSNHAVLKPSDTMLGADAQAVCTTCHEGADDKGAAAATAMRVEIGRLSDAIARTAALTARVKNAGIEMSAQELALAEARAQLTRARTEVHTFDPARVAPVTAEGLRIVSGVEAAADQGSRELGFRRRGLAVSLAAMLLLIVALGMKIRQIDSRGA